MTTSVVSYDDGHHSTGTGRALDLAIGERIEGRRSSVRPSTR